MVVFVKNVKLKLFIKEFGFNSSLHGEDKLSTNHFETHDIEITNKVTSKWQNIIDVITNLAEVPVGFISKLNPEDIEIFVSGNREFNPFEKGKKYR